jgi:signal transduction histidine kinase
MVVQDVTTMKELERLREEWTSVIAHDLRQPVNVIALSAALLDEAAAPSISGDQRVRVIGSIRRAAQSLDRMIADLLDASRIEARRMSVNRRATSLPALVREIVERVPDVAERCLVEVAPGAEREVLADPLRIEQVLTNLLTNAVKYGERGTHIRVEVIGGDRDVEVIVTNHGAGIAPGDVPRLFRRFERTEDARAARVRGIGLGLYLCKGLVEAHGGRIWVESTPGATTSFHFTLPHAPVREAEARA